MVYRSPLSLRKSFSLLSMQEMRDSDKLLINAIQSTFILPRCPKIIRKLTCTIDLICNVTRTKIRRERVVSEKVYTNQVITLLYIITRCTSQTNWNLTDREDFCNIQNVNWKGCTFWRQVTTLHHRGPLTKPDLYSKIENFENITSFYNSYRPSALLAFKRYSW